MKQEIKTKTKKKQELHRKSKNDWKASKTGTVALGNTKFATEADTRLALLGAPGLTRSKDATRSGHRY